MPSQEADARYCTAVCGIRKPDADRVRFRCRDLSVPPIDRPSSDLYIPPGRSLPTEAPRVATPLLRDRLFRIAIRGKL